ncbi:MAG: hypothetical protein R3F19_05685 [Verrucomicrobiales bacterium]
MAALTALGLCVVPAQSAIGIVTGLGSSSTSNTGTGATAISAFNASLLGTETIVDGGDGSTFGIAAETTDTSVSTGSTYTRTASSGANSILGTTGFTYAVKDSTLAISKSGLTESDYGSAGAFLVEGLPNGVDQGGAADLSNFGYDSESTGNTNRGVAHFHFSDPIGHFGVNVLDFESPIPADWDGVSVGIDTGGNGTIDTVVPESIIEGQIIVFRNGSLIGSKAISWDSPQGLGVSDIQLGSGRIGFVGIGTVNAAEAFTDVYLVVGGTTVATGSTTNPTFYNPGDLTGSVTTTANALEGSKAASNQWAVSGMIFGPALSTIPEPSVATLCFISTALLLTGRRHRRK